MKLSQRIKTAYNVITQKALTNSIGTVLRNYNDGSVFNPQNQLKGITYKAIDKIGQSVSKYEPVAKNAKGDTVVNHPILSLAKNPNPQSNSSDFNHLWAMLDEIYGETYFYLAKGEMTKKVKEVYLLDPSRMEAKYYEGELVGYILHKADGSQVPLEVDEIIHNKRPNPFNPSKGFSVLERASVYVDTEIVTSQFTLSYMKNNASPSGIVSLPDMGTETFKQFTQQWREGYEGPHNAGKTAFIRGGEATFKAVGATLRDVDQKVTRDMAKEDVLMMFEVPKPLLGGSEQVGLGRSTIDSLFYIFNKETIDPMMERLDRVWEQIAKVGGVGAELKGLDHISPIPEDKEYELLRNEKAVNNWITINEAREKDGLEPIPGGDVIQPRNVAPAVAPVKSFKKVTIKKALTKTELLKEANDKNEAFRLKLVETNEIYEKELKREIAKFAGKQEEKVIEGINLSQKAFEEWLPSVKESSLKLMALLTPIVLDLMEAQSAGVANFITGELMVISPELRKVTEAQILKISGVYNADTIKALEATLTEGTTNGESLVKLKKRVEATYQDAKGYRAERIARTESLRASNKTAEETYSQNGYSTVEWFVNPGACDFCKQFAGRTKTIGGSPFAPLGSVIENSKGDKMRIEYDDIGTPPLHPACKCSIVPGK